MTLAVRTPGFVRIRTPKENVQGYNLVADEDLETYTLARVTGQVTYEEDTDSDDGTGQTEDNSAASGSPGQAN